MIYKTCCKISGIGTVGNNGTILLLVPFALIRVYLRFSNFCLWEVASISFRIIATVKIYVMCSIP